MQVKKTKRLIAFVVEILGAVLLFAGLNERDYFEDRQTGEKYYYTINEDRYMSADSSTWWKYKLENGKKLGVNEVPKNWKKQHERANMPLIVIGMLLVVSGGIYALCLCFDIYDI